MTAGSNFEAPINDSQFKTSDASLGSGGGEKNLFTEVMDDIQKSGIDEGVRQLRVASMEMMGGKADPADKGFPPADSVMDTGKATEQGDKNFDQANNTERLNDATFAKWGAVGAMMKSELSPENQAKQRQTELHWADLEKNIA